MHISSRVNNIVDISKMIKLRITYFVFSVSLCALSRFQFRKKGDIQFQKLLLHANLYQFHCRPQFLEIRNNKSNSLLFVSDEISWIQEHMSHYMYRWEPEINETWVGDIHIPLLSFVIYQIQTFEHFL